MSQGQNLTTNEKLKLLTGSDVLDERPMLDYLQPLSTWLSSRPQAVSTMWAQPCPDPRSGKVLDDDVIREFLNRYDAEAQRVWSKYTEMVYTFETNITDYNEEQMVHFLICALCFSRADRKICIGSPKTLLYMSVLFTKLFVTCQPRLT